MREDINARVSALVDDEIGSDELRFMLKRMADDPALVDQYRRYVLVREALARNLTTGDVDLRAGINAALDAEQPVTGAADGVVRRLLRPAAGMAVAASVALGVVALWPQLDDRAVPPGASVAASDADSQSGSTQGSGVQFAADSDAGGISDRGSGAASMDADMHRKLSGFLVNHSEHSAGGQFGGVLSFSRIAGHDEASE